ncbi:unnamed protein product [Protopolystoma xenopodis]|uniref:Uncharacterized protein n=1 Tax=Protopolystoma xenopodis TaxID=117903 RepID=A0A448X6S3_9PLAT|nr:unnamed protein product [Protopolystoma xenopodis]
MLVEAASGPASRTAIVHSPSWESSAGTGRSGAAGVEARLGLKRGSGTSRHHLRRGSRLTQPKGWATLNM